MLIFYKINYTFGKSIISWINISFYPMKRRIIHFFFILFVCLGLLFSCSGSDSELEPVNNEYELDGEVFGITTEMFWVRAGSREAVDQLRLLEPLVNTDLYDMIILSPRSGSSSIEGTYIYSKTGDVGTYNLEFVHAVDAQGESEWFTNGDEGDRLEIVFIGEQEGRDVYRVTLTGFILNYGYWDYLAGKWVSFGQKPFKLSYEGGILPQ